ncbi:MAG: hypothetical protein U5L09_01645 [Bacteroidales bacterium]|nr:hypothetical protein [Bacteroidales bacterium]
MHKKLTILTITLLITAGCFSQNSSAQLFEKVDEYHRSFITIDSHSDTPLCVFIGGL